MLGEYKRLYKESMEKRIQRCGERIAIINKKAIQEIQDYLKPPYPIIIHSDAGPNSMKFDTLDDAIRIQCINGYNTIVLHLPKFNEIISNPRGDTLNIVTGKYSIEGYHTEGFLGPNIVDEIKKMTDPGLLVTVYKNTIRIEVPVP
jgi:hypothetical protein